MSVNGNWRNTGCGTCGHSFGAHGNGSVRALLQTGKSYWACIVPGCACLIFETIEGVASRIPALNSEPDRG